MTRLIHTADTHVGYQQYHSPERRADFLRAFESVVADAIAAEVDAVVHAGDLFHDRRPGLVDIQGVIGALRRLDDAGIPFLAVVGNHETKRDAQWLDLFEDLGLATRLGHEPVVVGDVALYGQDFVPASGREDLAYDFRPVEDDDAPAFAALASHGAFEPFAHADWDTGALLAASPVEFDALLLGDIHHPGREEVDGVLATYPGSTERASAEERAERGYNIVEFGGEVPVSVTRRSVAEAREFVFVDLDLEEGEGEARVREAVRQHDLEDAVLVVTVEGEGDPITPAGIEEFAVERGAEIARVNDRREIQSEGEAADVSFADPDQAVDSRVTEMGLSEAAHGLDALVRTAEDVADSRVREAAKRRVKERLEEDPASLEGVADESGGETSDTGTPGEESAPDAATDADDGEDTVEAAAGGGTGEDADDTTEPDGDAGEPVPAAEEDTDRTARETDDGEAVEPADQASMEEYL